MSISVETLALARAFTTKMIEEHGGVPPGEWPIKYNTTEGWNSQRDLVSTKGTIYIYSDHRTEVIDDQTVFVPGIKVGDGLAFLIDMPFANDVQTQDIIDQVTQEVTEHVIDAVVDVLNESKSLVSPEDRISWDSKVKSEVNQEDPENLVFYF